MLIAFGIGVLVGIFISILMLWMMRQENVIGCVLVFIALFLGIPLAVIISLIF